MKKELKRLMVRLKKDQGLFAKKKKLTKQKDNPKLDKKGSEI